MLHIRSGTHRDLLHQITVDAGSRAAHVTRQLPTRMVSTQGSGLSSIALSISCIPSPLRLAASSSSRRNTVCLAPLYHRPTLGLDCRWARYLSRHLHARRAMCYPLSQTSREIPRMLHLRATVRLSVLRNIVALECPLRGCVSVDDVGRAKDRITLSSRASVVDPALCTLSKETIVVQ